MLKIASVSGALPHTPLGSLRRSPNPLVVRGFLHSAIAVSGLRRLIPLEPPKQKVPAPLAPQTQNPRTATDWRQLLKIEGKGRREINVSIEENVRFKWPQMC